MSDVQNVFVTNNQSYGLLAPFIAPPLAPPGYLIYETCTRLSDAAVHPMFVWVAGIGEGGAFLFGVWLLYRYSPVGLAAVLTALYFAASYGAAATYMQLDHIWTGGIVVFGGIIGYIFGHMIATDEHRLAREAVN